MRRAPTAEMRSSRREFDAIVCLLTDPIDDEVSRGRSVGTVEGRRQRRRRLQQHRRGGCEPARDLGLQHPGCARRDHGGPRLLARARCVATRRRGRRRPARRAMARLGDQPVSRARRPRSGARSRRVRADRKGRRTKGGGIRDDGASPLAPADRRTPAMSLISTN